jgi:alpha-D-ribose 1-methylphosphonate 5-phosphate C-P lyase
LYKIFTRGMMKSEEMSNLDDPTMETGLRMLGQGMKRRYQSVDPMTRVSFWRAFGIPSSKQLCYEEVVGKACVQYPVDPQIIPHPQLRMY